MIKYAIEYNDIKNILHRIEIYDDSYSGDEIEINGTAILDYADTDDPLECVRGSGLRVELEANSTLTYDDLYSEEQKTFKVIYYRDSVIKFTGWLNPEGWYEDFVNDKWKVSFDCIDGLSFLKDLSFVEDATGLNITGKQTQLQVISKALIRTGLTNNINVDIQIFYTGLSNTSSILENVNVNASRYVEEDDDTISSCDEVLRDILEPYCALITSHNGEWYIYKPNQLYSDSELSFFRYDYLGVALSPTTGTLETGFDLGSEINAFYPHHCSANQSISMKNSIGAYRINYKYGSLKNILTNPDFCNIGGTVDGWNNLGDGNVTLPTSGNCGISVNILDELSITDQLDSDTIAVPISTSFTFTFTFRLNTTDTDRAYFNAKITLVSGGTTYYLSRDGVWVTTLTYIDLYAAKNIWKQSNVIGGLTPIAGDIKVTIATGNYQLTAIYGVYDVASVVIKNTTENLVVEGEAHTFQRTTKPSSNVEDNKEVLTGDNEEDVYVGALYKADTTTTTSTWYRKGMIEMKGILQIMGEETLRMSGNPARVFSGDVYGFFDYLSVVSIDGISGLFMPTRYSYNTYENIISVELRQIFGDELGDIDYLLTYDYGNVIKPTIKG